jgi:hypothetical protein
MIYIYNVSYYSPIYNILKCFYFIFMSPKQFTTIQIAMTIHALKLFKNFGVIKIFVFTIKDNKNWSGR